MMEQNNPEVNEDLGSGGKFKNWFQDNIRIIISVLIVVVIAVGIYSYSKRGETPATSEEVAVEQPQSVEITSEKTAVTVIGEDQKEAESEAKKVEEATEKAVEEVEKKVEETEKKVEEKIANIDEEAKKETEKKAEEAKNKVDQVIEEAKNKVEEKKEEPKQQEVKVDEQASSQSISEETGEAFVETAVAGDSLTTLSRKALKNYLEKNQDSSLTPEHKIYIEDYLRRNVNFNGRVNVGTQVSFSKNLIKDAIEKSKTLNENQLNNLKRYAAQVPGL